MATKAEKGARATRVAIACILIWTGLSLASCGSDSPFRPDPHDFTVDRVRFSCGRWFEGPTPQGTWGLFDVHFGTLPDDIPPTREQLALVRAVGGILVHEFNAPIVRAIIQIEMLPDLNRTAWGVPDADTFLVSMSGKLLSKATEDDRAYLRGMGVTIRGEVELGNGTLLGMDVPDEQIPAIRAWGRWSRLDVARWSICPAM